MAEGTETMSERSRFLIGLAGLLASPLLLLVPHYLFWFGIWYMLGGLWFCCWVCIPFLSEEEDEESPMSPKQQTMHEICNLLDADAKKDGMGLDREMFSKKNMRQTHKFLLSALENMRRARQKGKR